MTAVQDVEVLGSADRHEADVTGGATRPRRWLGLVAAAAGLGGAMLAHQFVPAVGVLTWAVALGMVAGNTRLLPAMAAQALGGLTRRLLRSGIVLLGFSVSFGSIAALGLGTVGLVAATLVATLVVTTWLGNRVGLGRARSLLIGTGFAICGASAIAAMEETAGADEEDVAVGIAMVTLFGTLAMVLMPLLWHPLGLTDVQFGVWDGREHPGGGPGRRGRGSRRCRGGGRRRRRQADAGPAARTGRGGGQHPPPDDLGRPGGDAKRPPIVPLFVLGFVACVAVRSTGVVPADVLGAISQVQVAALAAALFGMGAGVKVRSLLTRSGPVLAVAAASTVFVAGLALAGVLLLGG